MANKPLQSLTFPGLPDTYTVPQLDTTLTQAGSIADAKKVGDELTNLRDDLSGIEESIFDSGINVPISSVLINTIAGYSVDAVSSGTLLTLHPYTQYKSYYLKFTKSCDVWFETIPSTSYIAVAKIDNAGNITDYTESGGAVVKRVEGNNGIRYRKSENNLPSSANKLHINVGTMLVVTIPSTASADSFYMSFDFGEPVIYKTLLNNNIRLNASQLEQVAIDIDPTLTISGEAADAKATGDVKDKVDNIEQSIFSPASQTTSYPLNEVLTNSKIGNVTVPSATYLEIDKGLTNYTTYYLIFDGTRYLWFEDVSALSYIAIAKLNNPHNFREETSQSGRSIAVWEGDSGVRYRKSENNLPSSNNKLTVSSGMLVVVTIPSSVDAGNVIINIEDPNQQPEEFDYTLLNNDIKLNNNQLAQVSKTNYVQYINGAGEDSSTERLNIYLATFNGYILFQFVHTVLASINSNVWRISKAQFTDAQFNVILDITTTGEWECAIKLDGRSDFSGGVLHGDEVLNNISFFLDGRLINPSVLSSKTPFTTLSIVQDSNLYDPNDSTTVFANHSSLHLFNDKLTIKQALKFAVDCVMGISYLAMFPISKTCSNKYFTDQQFEYQDTTLPVSQQEAKEVTLVGNNVESTFTLISHTNVDSRTGALSIQDNGGNPYNKCYYISCGTGASVQANTIWKSETEYKISR